MSRDGQVAWHGFDNTSASPRFDDIPKAISREGMVMVDNTRYTPETIRANPRRIPEVFQEMNTAPCDRRVNASTAPRGLIQTRDS